MEFIASHIQVSLSSINHQLKQQPQKASRMGWATSCRLFVGACSGRVEQATHLADLIVVRRHVPDEHTASLIDSNAAAHEGRHNVIFKLGGSTTASILLPVDLL